MSGRTTGLHFARGRRAQTVWKCSLVGARVPEIHGVTCRTCWAPCGLVNRDGCSNVQHLNFRQPIIIYRPLPVLMIAFRSSLPVACGCPGLTGRSPQGSSALLILAGRPFAHVKYRGIILNLAKPLIGCVAQTAVVGPAPEIDLGNQCRLRKYEVLAFERHDGRFVLSLSSVAFR
jgi:hypothetical protein